MISRQSYLVFKCSVLKVKKLLKAVVSSNCIFSAVALWKVQFGQLGGTHPLVASPSVPLQTGLCLFAEASSLMWDISTTCFMTSSSRASLQATAPIYGSRNFVGYRTCLPLVPRWYGHLRIHELDLVLRAELCADELFWKEEE